MTFLQPEDQDSRPPGDETEATNDAGDIGEVGVEENELDEEEEYEEVVEQFSMSDQVWTVAQWLVECCVVIINNQLHVRGQMGNYGLFINKIGRKVLNFNRLIDLLLINFEVDLTNMIDCVIVGNSGRVYTRQAP